MTGFYSVVVYHFAYQERRQRYQYQATSLPFITSNQIKYSGTGMVCYPGLTSGTHIND